MKVYLKLYELDDKSDAKSLEKSVEEEKGIKSVSVSFRKKIAKVRFDPDIISEHRVKVAFLKAGHVAGVYRKSEPEQPDEPDEAEETEQESQQQVKDLSKVKKDMKKQLHEHELREQQPMDTKEKKEFLKQKNELLKRLAEKEKEEKKLQKKLETQKKKSQIISIIRENYRKHKQKKKEKKRKEAEKKKQQAEKIKQQEAEKKKALAQQKKKEAEEAREKKKKEAARKRAETLRKKKEKKEIERKLVEEERKKKLEEARKKRDAEQKKKEKEKKRLEKLKRKKAIKKLGYFNALELGYKNWKKKLAKKAAERAKEKAKKGKLKAAKNKEEEKLRHRKEKERLKEQKKKEKAKAKETEPEPKPKPKPASAEKKKFSEIFKAEKPAKKPEVNLHESVIPRKTEIRYPDDNGEDAPEEPTEQMERLRIKTLFAAILAVPLFYITIGPLFGLPLTYLLAKHLAVIKFILAAPIIALGYRYFLKCLRSIISRKPNMYTLIGLGAAVPIIYSLWFFFSDYFVNPPVRSLMFDLAALIIAFSMIGQYLEAKLHRKVVLQIKHIAKNGIKKARLLKKDDEKEVSLDKVKVGDILNVKPGERIPLDGIIVNGYAAVDESAVTADMDPVNKDEGNRVYAGSVVNSGSVNYKVEKLHEKSTLMKMAFMVVKSYSDKTNLEKYIDRISRFTVPAVLCAAIIAFAFWTLAGKSFALTSLISVLIIANPSALGLAAPTAVMAGAGRAAKYGILIKSGRAIQRITDINTIMISKEILVEKPEIFEIKTYNKSKRDDVLKLAASAWQNSSNPLAKEITRTAIELGMSLSRPSRLRMQETGTEATVRSRKVLAGTRKFIESKKINLSKLEGDMKELGSQGISYVIVAAGRKAIGLIGYSERLRPYAGEVVNELHKMKKKVVLVSADNKDTVDAVGAWLNADAVVSGQDSKGKTNFLKKLQSKGRKVLFVGNDEAVLDKSDLGISIGKDIDKGDVVVLNNNLYNIVTAKRICTLTMRKLKQNIIWGFLYNVIAVAFAAGLFYTITGSMISPVFAAMLMAASPLVILYNSLRLRRFRQKQLKLE